jgi:hypothetical protein
MVITNQKYVIERKSTVKEIKSQRKMDSEGERKET